MQDLYYLIPQERLIACVKRCIQLHDDEFKFVSNFGISMASFLAILMCYLNSNIIGFEDNWYIQKEGVCIGYKITPILSNVFLGCVDEGIERCIKGQNIRISRYLDDYLVIMDDSPGPVSMNAISELLKQEGMGLKFTHEVPEQQKSRLLHLLIFVKPAHLCKDSWPRSKIGILNYSSANSNIEKDRIATLCLRAALQKICHHKIKGSVFRQVGQLVCAGFPERVVTRVCEKFIKSLNYEGNRDNNLKNSKKIAVVSHVHRMSHGLKNVSSQFGERVLFFQCLTSCNEYAHV